MLVLDEQNTDPKEWNQTYQSHQCEYSYSIFDNRPGKDFIPKIIDCCQADG